jgi:hypothetical protein
MLLLRLLQNDAAPALSIFPTLILAHISHTVVVFHKVSMFTQEQQLTASKTLLQTTNELLWYSTSLKKR